MIERHRDAKQDLHGIYIDLEKAFDRVPRNFIYESLRAHQVPEEYVQVIKDMYSNIYTKIRCAAGISNDFNINVGVHQGSVLSPLLFNIVMNYLTRNEMSTALEIMLFADDIVMISNDVQEIQDSLNRWQTVLERNGLRISRSKTEFQYFPFNDSEAPIPNIYLENIQLPHCKSFNYLGSRISSDGSCDDDVNHRVQIGWMNWHKEEYITPVLDQQCCTELNVGQ